MPIVPQITLPALTLVSPVVVGDTFSVDSSVLPLLVDASLTTTQIEVTVEGNTYTSTSFTVVTGKRRFSLSLPLIPSPQQYQILLVGRNYDPQNPGPGPSYGITPSLRFYVLYTQNSNLPVVDPPSGVKIYKGLNSCKVEWVKPTEQVNLLGVRVAFSTDISGVIVPYQQFGNLVTTVTRFENNVITASTSKSVNGDVTTTTTVANTIPIEYSTAIFTTENTGDQTFYVVLSTVIQDPDTNHIYESNFNGPFTCGYVDLRQVSPTDFINIQQKEEIASRLISSTTRNLPDLDLSPRSELRDTHIDPISLELSAQSVREWFGRVSTSISALATIDDYDEDGFSDPFDSNPFKLNLARAWNLGQESMQFLIDKQFDILGERAGIYRGGSTTSVAPILFYTYSKPSTRVTIDLGAQIATQADSDTPSLTFITRGSAIIDPLSLNSLYDPEKGWWAVTIPAECMTPGAIGNVGAGTITQIISSAPSGWLCTNLAPADFGSDREQNSRYAERIKDRLVVGMDSGRRLGYLNVARATPGVVEANVVASGDLEMLRDWDPLRKKHIFGTVDIYTRGTDFSQLTSQLSFSYQNTSHSYRDYTSYMSLELIDATKLSFRVQDYDPTYPLLTIIDLIAQRGSDKFFLGSSRAKIDTTTGMIFLDPTEMCYKLGGDAISEAYEPFVLNGTPASNAVAVNALSSSVSSYSFKIWGRINTPLKIVPTYQPVTKVYSVAGVVGKTDVIASENIRFIRQGDPLLEGFSNKAKDIVQVDATTTKAVLKTIQFTDSNPVPLDRFIPLSVDALGNLGNILSVRSADGFTLYQHNIHYTLTVLDKYQKIGIVRRESGTPAQDIPLLTDILVSYNQYVVHEYCGEVDGLSTVPLVEILSLEGTIKTPLRKGFIKNVWLPESYGLTTLTSDATLAAKFIPKQNRYIKVLNGNGQVMVEGQDFLITSDTNGFYLSRIITGLIPDGGAVTVSYYTNENFTFTTGYPGYVAQVASAVEEMRHAAADVLVKNMIQNGVDVSLTVELNSDATPEVMDGRIRTVVGIVLDNSRKKLTQAELIRQVKSLPGVSNVIVPLSKFAKSDGAYDIGIVIPTATEWTPIAQDPLFTGLNFPPYTYITSSPVLPNKTIPSGGLTDSFVGILHEGDEYRRMFSVKDFIARTGIQGGSFYIIGVNDQIDPITPIPFSYVGKVIISIQPELTNPAYTSFRATYQVFNEGGTKDIVISPTEYLKSGRVSIDYIVKG